MLQPPHRLQHARSTMVLAAALALAACQAVGPTTGAISEASSNPALSGITVIDVTASVAQQSAQREPTVRFADVLGDVAPVGTVVGVGDALEITIWEAPPATLFGAASLDGRGSATVAASSAIQTSRPTALPEFAVGPSGTINVPFAGNVPAAGRTLQQIEREIVSRLTGRANRPQAIVRLVRNTTATVTVVGDVPNATRMPLTPRGERLLDALAAAGGTRQPVDKITLQITRGEQTFRMPLQQIIDDPRNNVRLRVDDVVTALYRPYSFTVLGATGRNEEIPFEATGISFAQALGRVGGLQDGRAAAKGVFVFRWEDPSTPGLTPQATPSANGKVPVIYRFDLRDPASLFAVQNFRMRDHDIVYVANSPIAEFQRFVGLIASTVLPVAAVENSVTNN